MDADLRHLLGQRGTVDTDDTVAVTGEFSAIQIIEEAVFTALTEEAVTGSGSLVGPTHPQDRILLGRFTGYTLASGQVRAYNR
jgi:hypothetical protein